MMGWGGKVGLVLDLGLQLSLDIGYWILDSWVFNFFSFLFFTSPLGRARRSICISVGHGLIVFGRRHGLLGCWLTN